MDNRLDLLRDCLLELRAIHFAREMNSQGEDRYSNDYKLLVRAEALGYKWALDHRGYATREVPGSQDG